LRGFFTAGEHDDENAVPPREVQAIAWTEINSPLGDFATDGPPIAQIASLREAEPGSDTHLPPPILQSVKPILKLLRSRTENMVHCIRIDTDFNQGQSETTLARWY
jgi:hypothetical protein